MNYGMTLDEAILCAKMFSYAMGNRSVSLTQMDKEAAFTMLKRIADQRWDWTEEQKQQYKTLAELCKQLMQVRRDIKKYYKKELPKNLMAKYVAITYGTFTVKFQ